MCVTGIVLIKDESINGVRMLGALLKEASIYGCARVNYNWPSDPGCVRHFPQIHI